MRGGIAQHTAGTARALADAGHSVEVISYRRVYPSCLFPGRTLYDGSDALGRPLLDVLAPATWRRTARCIAALDADLVLGEWWHPIAAPALATCFAAVGRERSLLLAHNALPHEWFPGSRVLLRAVLRCVGGALCHSRAVAASLAELSARRGVFRASAADAPALAVAAMPMLIDLAGVPDRSEARRRLGIAADVPVALLPGHARRYKGVGHLLAAWDRAALEDGAVLLIAGESYLGRGRLEAEVAKRARAMSILLLNEYLTPEDVKACLASADVLVLPYTRASQSAWPALARALGLPMIVTSAGGLAEREAGGEPAEVVPAGDVAALAASLARTLDARERDRRAAAALGTHTMAASWRSLVEGIERFARPHA